MKTLSKIHSSYICNIIEESILQETNVNIFETISNTSMKQRYSDANVYCKRPFYLLRSLDKIPKKKKKILRRIFLKLGEYCDSQEIGLFILKNMSKYN